MKKHIIKVISVMVVAIGGANYMLYLTTGRSPFADMRDLSVSMPSLSDIPTLSRTTEAYKWTDADGRVHYGPEPPEGVQAERIEIKSDGNMLPAVETDKPAGGASPLPGSNAIKVLDDARAVRQALDERYQNVERH